MEQERVDEYQGLVRKRAADESEALEEKLVRLKTAWEELGKPGNAQLAKEIAEARLESIEAALKAVFSATAEFLAKYDLDLDFAFKRQLTKSLDDTFYPLADQLEENIRSDTAALGDNPTRKGDFPSLRREVEKIKVWYNNRIITFAFEMANRAGKKA